MRNVEAGLGRGEGGSERIREAWGEGGWSYRKGEKAPNSPEPLGPPALGFNSTLTPPSLPQASRILSDPLGSALPTSQTSLDIPHPSPGRTRPLIPAQADLDLPSSQPRSDQTRIQTHSSPRHAKVPL